MQLHWIDCNRKLLSRARDRKTMRETERENFSASDLSLRTTLYYTELYSFDHFRPVSPPDAGTVSD